ncbi:Activator of stress s 1 [Wallemia ichthyophaga EXF-994]|uniref:Activator of stress s 1 n=1 Tax=Wallemia ichthyophaga (strain EXF-994 / CBS 113033) TaxID=1299270 RepID=R9ACP7_WALI9|nr:Activator of stress s 1 [Wallemia ichthyophaga EXF-994]EOQ99859.1 Activator of stress s 1 [Wallemia ichthyophaga EXF-994]
MSSEISMPEIKQPASRRRQVQACSECRRRKIKCNRVFPCGPCKSRGDDAICREVQKHEESVTGCASATSMDMLTNRVLHLEAALRTTQQALPQNVQSTLLPPSLSLSHEMASGATPAKFEGQNRRGRPSKGKGKSIKSEDSGHGAIDATQTRPLGSGIVSNDSEEEEAAMILEDFAFGRREKSSLNNDRLKFGSTPASPAKSINNPAIKGDNEASANTCPGRSGPKHAVNFAAPTFNPAFNPPDFMLARNETSADNYQRNILSVLPSRKVGEALMSIYIRKVDFFQKVMHIPTLKKDQENFWNQYEAHATGGRLEIAPAFLGLYLMILCAAIHFADADEAVNAGLSPQEHESLPALYFAASRAALWASDYLENHNLNNLQTIVLMGLYLNNVNASSTHHSLLGAAIKIAQNLGLSRLGDEDSLAHDGAIAPESRGSKKFSWVGMWSCVITREVGRRIWWNLVQLDWFLAASHNYSYTIHPCQNRCSLPINIDDDDLVEGQKLESKPMSVYTGMTYQLTRLLILEPVREIVDEFNETGHITFEFTMKQDNKIKTLIEQLPAFYRMDFDVRLLGLSPEKNQIFLWERTLLNLSAQMRLVRLHRPFLSKGYRHKSYEQSKKTCVDAARTSLSVLRQTDRSGFLERWWICAYYAFASAIVIFIDLIHDDPMSFDAMQKREEIRSALNMLKGARSFSSGADHSASLLEGLLAEEVRQKPDLKRKLGDEGDSGKRNRSKDLSILVKKLSDEGQAAKASSPNSSHSTPHHLPEASYHPNSLQTYAMVNNDINMAQDTNKKVDHQVITDDLLKCVFKEGSQYDTSILGVPNTSNDPPQQQQQQPFSIDFNNFNTSYLPQANDMFANSNMQLNMDQLFDTGENNNSWGILGGNSLSYL